MPKLENIYQIFTEWPRGEGPGFPIQGSLVQNNWVAPR